MLINILSNYQLCPLPLNGHGNKKTNLKKKMTTIKTQICRESTHNFLEELKKKLESVMLTKISFSNPMSPFIKPVASFYTHQNFKSFCLNMQAFYTTPYINWNLEVWRPSGSREKKVGKTRWHILHDID